MTDVELSELTKQADAVGAQHAAQMEAMAKAKAAEAALLAKVIERIRPALKAICSRIRIEWTSAVTDAGIADGPQTATSTWHKERGLLLTEKLLSSSKFTGTSSKRERELWLFDSGEFATCGHSLDQTQWGGCSDTSFRDNWAPLTITQVVEAWDVDTVIGKIRDALTKQLQGKAPERTRAAHERAEKLSALAKLL